MARKAKNPNAPTIPKFSLARASGKKTAAAKLSIPTTRVESLVESIGSLLESAQKEVEGITFARGTITLYKV